MILSALFWPFWLTGLIFIVSCFLFKSFYPGLIIFFAMESVYGLHNTMIFPIYGIITIGSITVHVAVSYLKERVMISHM